MVGIVCLPHPMMNILLLGKCGEYIHQSEYYVPVDHFIYIVHWSIYCFIHGAFLHILRLNPFTCRVMIQMSNIS